MGKINWDKANAKDRMARNGTYPASTDDCNVPSGNYWRIRDLKRLGRKVRAYERDRNSDHKG